MNNKIRKSPMQKKFISFIGLGNYAKCSYYFEDPQKEHYPTRFVQVSLIRHLVLNGLLNPDDEILFIVTEAAKKRNYYDMRDEIGNVCVGLEEELKKMDLDVLKANAFALPKIDLLDIPEGKSEDELWEIFNTLAGRIKENDHVYYDITHSFRSLPMLALVVLNYLRVVKNIGIEKIFYGAWEARTKDNNVEQAPIFDLTPFVNLMEWTTAADHFITSGNPLAISELSKKDISHWRKTHEITGPNEAATFIKKFSGIMSNFTKNLHAVRGKELPFNLFTLKQATREAKKYLIQVGLSPYAQLFSHIDNKFPDAEVVAVPNKKSDSNNLLKMIYNTNNIIQYAFNHKMLQNAYTLLEENITTFGCWFFDMNYEIRLHREFIGKALVNKFENQKRSEKGQKEREFHFVDKLDRSFQQEKYQTINNTNLYEIDSVHSTVKMLRNDLNHAGMNDKPSTYQKFLQRGPELLKKFVDGIEKLRKIKLDES